MSDSQYMILLLPLLASGDYWGDFDYWDSIAIVGSIYYCDSCDTIEYIEFSAPQASSGSMAYWHVY